MFIMTGSKFYKIELSYLYIYTLVFKINHNNVKNKLQIIIKLGQFYIRRSRGVISWKNNNFLENFLKTQFDEKSFFEKKWPQKNLKLLNLKRKQQQSPANCYQEGLLVIYIPDLRFIDLYCNKLQFIELLQ